MVAGLVFAAGFFTLMAWHAGPDDAEQLARYVDRFDDATYHATYEVSHQYVLTEEDRAQIEDSGREVPELPVEVRTIGVYNDGDDRARVTLLTDDDSSPVYPPDDRFLLDREIIDCVDDLERWVDSSYGEEYALKTGWAPAACIIGGGFVPDADVGDLGSHGAMLAPEDVLSGDEIDPTSFERSSPRNIVGRPAACFVQSEEFESTEFCFDNSGALLLVRSTNSVSERITKATFIEPRISDGDFELPHQIGEWDDIVVPNP